MKIQSIEIKTAVKRFSVATEKNDKNGLRKKQLEAIEEFKRNNITIGAERQCYFSMDDDVDITYYCGLIKFFPTSTEEANLTLEVKPDKAILELMMSFCLQNVVEVCDKQTNLFKEMFIKHAKESQESVNTKINNSFLGKFLGVK